MIAAIELPAQEKQLSKEEIETQSQVTEYASNAGESLVAVMVTNLLTSGSMAKIWGMINSMQLSSYLPILKIALPSYSQPIINEILEISSFETIPIGTFFWTHSELIEVPEGDYEN